MLDDLWTGDCRKASLDGAGPGAVHATIKVSDDGRLPRVPRKWSDSGLILKVEVWGEVDKKGDIMIFALSQNESRSHHLLRWGGLQV